MADDDQQAPPQRYWFPYWTSPPAPAPRPALRPQLSMRDTRPGQPQPPSVTPSPSRRQPQQQAAQPPATPASSRGASTGGAGSPQPQPTRLSSRPSPSRAAQPLSPIREPSRGAPPQATAVSAPKENSKPLQAAKPATPPPQPSARPTKELDITVPQEKIIHEPPSSDTKPPHSKAHAVEKEKDKEKKEKDAKEHKEKDKDKEGKEKKEKEKDHNKEKEKEKEHKEKKDKDKHKEHHDESTLHKELKAGVADMVNKLGAATAPTAGQERQATGAGMTVITLAGENKGASMKISHADHAESKADKDRSAARKLDDAKQQEAQHGAAKGLTAFINSNVQVVNNSLVMQSSCNSGDPGVHLKLSTKAKKKGADGEGAGGNKGGAPAVAARTTTKKK